MNPDRVVIPILERLDTTSPGCGCGGCGCKMVNGERVLPYWKNARKSPAHDLGLVEYCYNSYYIARGYRGGHWLDHLYRTVARDGTVRWHSEPYDLGDEDWQELRQLVTMGWQVTVTRPGFHHPETFCVTCWKEATP